MRSEEAGVVMGEGRLFDLRAQWRDSLKQHTKDIKDFLDLFITSGVLVP